MNKAIVTNFFLPKKENNSNLLDIKSFFHLQSKVLTSQYPIFFARVVYHNSLLKVHEEVISYAQAVQPLSHKILAYLRSQEWLTDYPPAFTVQEVKLKGFQSISYICPIGYKNQRPEYIQIIAHNLLSMTLRESVTLSAILMSKYVNLLVEKERQKSEIKLLEEILHRMGHQLRNSIAMIGLYAHNLYLKLQDNPAQEQAVIVRESIQDLDTNLTQLLDCSQCAKLRIAVYDLKSILSESIICLKPFIERKNLKISTPEISTSLAVDRLQIKQVFDNILSNAVHFSPEFGTITCSWQIFQSEVLIKISDQGPGISQEDIKKIFTPFYSRRSGGTGLGLTIANKIVLDHQGSLWAQNLSGGGAQFSLILPRPANI